LQGKTSREVLKMYLLTSEAVKDPKVASSLKKLAELEAFSPSFNRLKESLKNYLVVKGGKEETTWAPYWHLEEAIMTYLYGEGHA